MNQSSDQEGFVSPSLTACLGGGLYFGGGRGALTLTMRAQLPQSHGLGAHINTVPPGRLTLCQPGSQQDSATESQIDHLRCWQPECLVAILRAYHPQYWLHPGLCWWTSVWGEQRALSAWDQNTIWCPKKKKKKRICTTWVQLFSLGVKTVKEMQ